MVWHNSPSWTNAPAVFHNDVIHSHSTQRGCNLLGGFPAVDLVHFESTPPAGNMDKTAKLLAQPGRADMDVFFTISSTSNSRAYGHTLPCYVSAGTSSISTRERLRDCSYTILPAVNKDVDFRTFDARHATLAQTSGYHQKQPMIFR